MIDIDEAQRIVLAHVRPGGTIEVPIGNALNRTLAAAVICDMDYPPFDRSLMDGYAVRAADVKDAPATLRVIGQVAAGYCADTAVASGEALQINTGAPVPSGADAVVKIEDTESSPSGAEVVILKSVSPGEFVAPQAEYVSAGDTVLTSDTLLTPLEIAAAAAAGATLLTVYQQPTVAVLTTGDELVDIDEKPTGAKIRNSNQHLLEALITAAHARPVVLGVADDEHETLRRKISEGLDSDMLCITGGVSMGSFDFVPEVLEQCGAALHVRRMAIKPGKPTVFATMPDGTPVFGLPGNPIGVFVAFELLVRPALAALEGRAGVLPRAVRGTLRGSLRPGSDRRGYHPGRARVTGDGEWLVEPLSWHGSGDSFGIATANALIMRPPGSEGAGTGDTVAIIPLDRI